MKKRFLSILLCLCMVLMFFPVTAFADEEPGSIDITITGPGEICAQQDYEFTVTAEYGVKVTYFDYQCGEYRANTGLSPDENGEQYGTVPAYEYRGASSIELTVYGMTADNKTVTATKTVEIVPEHIFEDGVCGCGAKQEYIVTYDGGADSGIMVAAKTHNEALTLAGKTFYREGYVQIGWSDKENTFYEFGSVYTTNADLTLYPEWDEIITLTVPFTTTVMLDDSGVPGETTFDLAVVDANAGEDGYADVTVSGSVTTNGAGDYDGEMTLTGPSQQLWYMLCEGAFVQQVDAGEDGWTYDHTVWGLLLSQIAAYSTMDNVDYTVLVLPTVCEETDDGVRYDIDWESIDWDAELPEEMSFENIYTAHVYELKYDETNHWDECDCDDIQNKEPHKYGNWTVTKEATETEKGEKEHTCTVCGYQETEEIAKLSATDTIKPTESNPNTVATTSPQTGDNSNLFLWIALLFVGSFGVIGTGMYSKRRRNSRAK